jgi:hypothetical protein
MVDSQTGWVNSFLPELVSGRGTARRSRAVEGQASARFRHNPAYDRIKIIEKVARGDTKRLNSSGAQPFVASCVPGWSVASRMDFAVDFNGQPSIAAKRIENIRSGWMLASEFEPTWVLPEHLPQKHLRERHLTAKMASVSHSPLSGLRRDILEHEPCPSTVLRTVPLPETSSGRS